MAFHRSQTQGWEISIHFPVQILCMLHRQKRCHLENCPNPSDQMDFLKRTRISSSPATIWGKRRYYSWMWNQSECSQNNRFFTQCWWWVAWGLWEHLYPRLPAELKKHGATKTDALLLVYLLLLVSIQFLYMLMIWLPYLSWENWHVSSSFQSWNVSDQAAHQIYLG